MRASLAQILAAAGFLTASAVGPFVPSAIAASNDDVLDVTSPNEIAGLDPAKSGYIFSRTQVVETLFTINRDRKLVPMLARESRTENDGLIWHFTLRDDVVFHDGTPMTPQIVADDLQRAFERPGVLHQAPITKIAATDNGIVVTLSSPFAMLPAFLSHYSTVILAPSSFDENGDVTSIIGTGAYKVDTVTPPLHVELSAFDQWWNGHAHIEKINYLAIGRGETRTMMVQSGDADLAISLLPVSVTQLKSNPDVNVTIATVPRTRMLKLNLAKPFFDEVTERKALSMAINREALSAVVMRNRDLAATKLFPPSIPGWSTDDSAPLEYNPDAARKLLADAGWKPGADGVLENDGKRFEVTLRTYASRPDLPLLATALQSQLRDVGIAVNISVGSYTEIPAGHADGTLDLALLTRSFSQVPDPAATVIADYGPGGADWGSMNWSNTEAFDLVADLKSTADPIARVAIQEKLAAILQNDLPTIPVVWSELAVASTAKLENVYVDPYEQNYHLADMRWAP
ncbi:ABC transporter substrate-binding protein [Thalassospira povalilytica]|uniref:ABC transporter substrate-binding protein n=1 Tax=Thalassospira povalilytica TaxID=732237 RepID=UPI003AA9171C